MKAIRFYRRFWGDYTLRITGRIMTLCRSRDAQLFAFENNTFVPLQGLFSYLKHIELNDFCTGAEYDEKSVVILCFTDENDDLLQEIFEVLKYRYVEGQIPEIPNYGRSELIDIPADSCVNNTDQPGNTSC